MDDGKNLQRLFTDNVFFLLIGMGSAAFIVSMYHVIAICLCNQRITHQNQNQNQNPSQQQQEPLPQTQSTSLVSHVLIPTHKYHKKNSGGVCDEDGTCAVCLGDFEEGEELRSLPECLHAFHVSCIDTWLCSHSSCPICRASATPSIERDLNNPRNGIDVLQIPLAQNALVQR